MSTGCTWTRSDRPRNAAVTMKRTSWSVVPTCSASYRSTAPDQDHPQYRVLQTSTDYRLNSIALVTATAAADGEGMLRFQLPSLLDSSYSEMKIKNIAVFSLMVCSLLSFQTGACTLCSRHYPTLPVRPSRNFQCPERPFAPQSHFSYCCIFQFRSGHGGPNALSLYYCLQ